MRSGREGWGRPPTALLGPEPAPPYAGWSGFGYEPEGKIHKLTRLAQNSQVDPLSSLTENPWKSFRFDPASGSTL